MSASSLGKHLLPWVLPLLLLLTWHMAVQRNWVSRRTLPAPVDVARAAIRLTNSGELPKHLAESSKRAFGGLAIGGSLGLALALLNGLSRISRRLLDSSIQMLRNVPHLAIIPLVIVWLGIDESAKRILIVTGVLFPIYLNTLHGIRSLDPRLLEMGRIYGLGPWALFWHVILPGALPSIFTGLRYALGIMWLTLIVAETISSDDGIGYMTMNAREFFQMDVVMLGVLLYALLGKAADSTVHLLEGWFLRWNPQYQLASR